MTARRKRAVWVAPGTTLDRHDTVGQSISLAGQVLLRKVFDRRRGLEERSSGVDGRIEGVGLAGGRTTNPTLVPSIHLSDSVNHLSETKAGALVNRGSEPRVSIHDPFLLLYELEQHRGTFEILLFLHRERSVTATRMRRRLRSGQEALEASLACLRRLGLVNIDPVRGFPFTKTYRLTERGLTLIETPLSSWFRVLTE
jgi:DNA-binding HxlR family transcriptional regulator